MNETIIDALADEHARAALREMLIATDPDTLDYNDDDFDCYDDTDPSIEHELRLRPHFHDALTNRELITHLALALSLCPMHLCDYAICFDDQNDDCAAIRLIHPEHDT